MKNALFFLFAFVAASVASSATLVIEGKYQNKNLYVHNGFIAVGVGFCAKEIIVNGEITTDETNSSSFEIDLKSMQFKYGDDVTIEIIHSDECVPRVLNLEDLKPKPTYEVLMMNLNPDGILKWGTKEESGILPYVVGQFKWNKWVPVGEVVGLGTSDYHEYSFKVGMHSGENVYRIKQKGLNAITKVSKEISVVSLLNKPSFAIPADFSSIDFSAETAYELYDMYGQILRRGYGKQIDIRELDSGSYYLCYDNTLARFKK